MIHNRLRLIKREKFLVSEVDKKLKYGAAAVVDADGHCFEKILNTQNMKANFYSYLFEDVSNVKIDLSKLKNGRDGFVMRACCVSLVLFIINLK